MRLLTEEDYLVLTAAKRGEALCWPNRPIRSGVAGLEHGGEERLETFEHLTVKHPVIRSS